MNQQVISTTDSHFLVNNSIVPTDKLSTFAPLDSVNVWSLSSAICSHSVFTFFLKVNVCEHVADLT